MLDVTSSKDDKFEPQEDKVKPDSELPSPSKEDDHDEVERVLLISRELRALAREDAPSLDGPGTPIEQTTPAALEEEALLSSRVLMVQAQQIMCQELQTEIRNGAAWLAGLEERSRLLNNYLNSAEVEFSTLEAQTMVNEGLPLEIEDLRKQHAEALAAIDEQKAALQTLSDAKDELSAHLAATRSENVRLQEFKRVQLVESGRLKAKLLRNENANFKLQEKISLLESEREQLLQTRNDLENQLSRSASNVTEANKTCGTLGTRIKELEGTLEHRSDDLASLREQYSDLKSKFSEWQVNEKDKAHEADMKKRELEQLLRLKEKRIAELESLHSGGGFDEQQTDVDTNDETAAAKHKSGKGPAKANGKAA